MVLNSRPEQFVPDGCFRFERESIRLRDKSRSGGGSTSVRFDLDVAIPPENQPADGREDDCGHDAESNNGRRVALRASKLVSLNSAVIARTRPRYPLFLSR